MDIKVKNVRIAFCDSLEVAKDYNGDKKFRHSATLLVDLGSEADKTIRSAILQSAKVEFKDKAEGMLEGIAGNTNKNCYTKGDLKLGKYDGFDGKMALAAHRGIKQGPPKLRAVDGKTAAEPGLIYAGCYVNAVVSIYAQSKTNIGIRCGLIGVQFLRDGDAFSGSRLQEGAFDDLSVGGGEPSEPSEPSDPLDDLMG